MMFRKMHPGLDSSRFLDRLSHTIFLCCPVVDLASPFSRLFGGLRVTFRPQPGGLRVTFLRATISCSSLQSIVLRFEKLYAKVLFTNPIETKAGLSPDCLKENSIGDQECHRSCRNQRLTLQKKAVFFLVAQLRASGDKSLPAGGQISV